MGLWLPLRLMPLGGGCSAWERWPMQYRGWLSTGVLVAISSFFSPEPPAPDSPHVSMLLLLQPRVSGCKRNFCVSPLRGSLHLQSSLPGGQKPLCFSQLDVMWVLSPALVLSARELSLGFRTPTSQVETLSCWSIPLELWHHQWEPHQPSHASSTLPTSLVVLKWFFLSVLGYKTSFQLVFSWLFRMISLQFSCNSSWVLGGG